MRGQHVFGQAILQILTQIILVRLVPGYVNDQLLLVRHHNGIAYRRTLTQDNLNFAWLNAKPTDF
jgi:hypothetical protein